MKVARVSRFIPVVVALLIEGCGGGGGASSASTLVAAPVTETFFVRGVAGIGGCPNGWWQDGFAFSFYSGIVFDTAQLTVDGQPSDVSRMVSRIYEDGNVMLAHGSRTRRFDGNATFESSRATSIDTQHVVIGTVESVDAAHARLSALGQLIYVSDTTCIDGDGTIGGFVAGERISVSGFFSPGGEVVATSIHRDPGGEGFLLRGILHVDESGVVRVGRSAVGDVSGIAFVGFPDTRPAEGDPVLVLGAYIGDVPAAESISFIGGDLGEGPEDIRSVSGMISSRPGPSELELEGRAVDCAFFQCATLKQAQLGTLVAVVQDENGNRVQVVGATSGTIGVTGPVEAVETQNNALTVLGFPVQVLPATEFVDEALQPKAISDIQIGDTVTVVGGPVGDLVVAGRIGTYGDQPSISARTFISARPFSFVDPEIHVLGRTILTDGTTAVYEDCVGQRDQRWLFEVAAESSTQLRLKVSQANGGEIIASRIDVETDACSPWG